MITKRRRSEKEIDEVEKERRTNFENRVSNRRSSRASALIYCIKTTSLHAALRGILAFTTYCTYMNTLLYFVLYYDRHYDLL